MLLPNNKKYLLYIKTAKTGGTSFVDYLNQIKNIKMYKRINNIRVLENVKEGDIIMVVNDNLNEFKEKYMNIFDKSYKIMISRNPYTKTLSCYNYHPLSKNKDLVQLLKNKKNLTYDSTAIDYKLKAPKSLWNNYSLFTHFYLKQTFGLVENEKLLVDKVIRFENLQCDINNLFSELKINVNNLTLKHLNSTSYKYHLEDVDKEVISLINNLFTDDFKHLNYDKI